MPNMLLEEVEYATERTNLGVWRRYVYPSGARFAEFRSHGELLGLPLIHYTFGICPETGKRIVARGIVAVGRFAVGGIAIGQASAGLLALGQAAIGVAAGLGQFSTGVWSVGQIALGVAFGLGQIAVGRVAIGQLAYGTYVLAQIGRGTHVWSMTRTDPAAVSFYRGMLETVKGMLGW